MAHRLIQRALRAAGRSTVIDEAIPARDLVAELCLRVVQLLRGLTRFRTLVFVGPRVHVKAQRNLELGRFAALADACVIDARATRPVRIGAASRLGRGCVVTTTSKLSRYGQGLEIGARSGIGDYGHLGCSGGVRIGDDVIVGPFVGFHSQEHSYARRDVPIHEQGTTELGIVVEDDVWIGARSTILDGSRIGRGCVVAAGSVVKGEFPAWSVIGGVPARVIKVRPRSS